MPRRIGVTWEQWPAADRVRWERATSPINRFASEATAAHWSEKTRQQARYAYARWLAYLVAHEPAVLEEPLEARVTAARVQCFVGERRRTPMTIAAELQHLLLALRAMAPDQDWLWLGKVQYAFAKEARPRERRHKMVDPRRLLALGEQLMDRADGEARPSERARLYRDGLLIVLLTRRPLRLRSLAALTCERHMQRVGDGYVIELDAQDTKSGHPVEFTVPAPLVPRIDTYLSRFRLLFPRAAQTSAFWLSSKGGPLCAEAIYNLVCRRTAKEFGFAINPHHFRNIAATTIAREAPAHVNVARDLLTHANFYTTFQFYCQAQTNAAAQRHGQTIEALRTAGGAGAQP